jgi:hypothetical protein
VRGLLAVAVAMILSPSLCDLLVDSRLRVPLREILKAQAQKSKQIQETNVRFLIPNGFTLPLAASRSQ